MYEQFTPFTKTSASKKQQRSRQNTYIGIILFIVGIGLIIWMALQSPSPSTDTPSVVIDSIQQGKFAPDFKAMMFNGGEISLGDHAGDVVVVNFWATWCPPCKAEMPGINAFYEAKQEEGLVVLAINARESESLVRPFIEANDFSFPVLLDPTGSIVDQYQVRSFPTTVIINRDGVVRHIQVGLISEEELETAVVPLL